MAYGLGAQPAPAVEFEVAAIKPNLRGGKRSDYDSTVASQRFWSSARQRTHMNVYGILIASAILTVECPVTAQPVAAVVEFEVASIKPNKSNSNSMSIRLNRGIWRATNTTVKTLLINAYEVLPEQMIGAPSWVDSDRFDIEGRYEEDASVDKPGGRNQNSRRLQGLLASRFQLQVHRETKEWQSYVLVVGKKGSKLTPAADGNSSMQSNNGHMEFKASDLENLAQNLASRLGRPVVNQTGIEGKFDFTVDYEPDDGRVPDKENPISGVETRRPSLFTAVQDQLGLKLESRKAPVEMLVVDRIERPSVN